MDVQAQRIRRVAQTAVIMAATVASVVALSVGQAAAHNLSCGDTITKDTKLRNDLLDCPGSGLVIGHGNITLDLGGHRIGGDGSFAGDGVDNSAGYNRVTIKNGTIFEFGRGAYLQSASRNRLSGLFVAGNELNGIELLDSHHNSIQRNSAVANDEGIVVGESNANTVDDNLSLRNEGEGIAFENASSNNRVTRNVSIRNGIGILVDATGSLHNLLDQNRANRNGLADPAFPEDGFLVEDATTVVKRNVANNNGAFGINALFGAVDGGGNKAAGNGEPAQCFMVVCT